MAPPEITIILRLIDGSSRNDGYYCLLEISLLGESIRIAEIYNEPLAEQIGRMVAEFFHAKFDNQIKEKMP